MVYTFGKWLLAELKDTSTFKTHLNYVKCVDKLLSGCTISIGIQTNSRLDVKKITKFQKLADITQKSIDNEISFIAQEAEYAQVVAPWLPVKCYYRLYYLESIFLFLLSGNEAVFKQAGHTAVRKNLQDCIKNNAITFSNNELNQIINLNDVMKHRGTSGANVRKEYYQSDDCIKAVRKKLGQYKELNFKDRKSAKNYWMTKKGRLERSTFLQNESIALTDYFYWMRIKANYKDVDFLDFDNISPSEVAEYVKHYVSATDKYANALNNAIAEVKQARGFTRT